MTTACDVADVGGRWVRVTPVVALPRQALRDRHLFRDDRKLYLATRTSAASRELPYVNVDRAVYASGVDGQVGRASTSAPRLRSGPVRVPAEALGIDHGDARDAVLAAESVQFGGRGIRSDAHRLTHLAFSSKRRHDPSEDRRYLQADVSGDDDLIPEGVEGAVDYRGSVSAFVHQYVGGLRQTMFYVGARTIPDLQQRGELVQITAAGMRESHPHDLRMTVDAPNYRSAGS